MATDPALRVTLDHKCLGATAVVEAIRSSRPKSLLSAVPEELLSSHTLDRSSPRSLNVQRTLTLGAPTLEAGHGARRQCRLLQPSFSSNIGECV